MELRIWFGEDLKKLVPTGIIRKGSALTSMVTSLAKQDQAEELREVEPQKHRLC